MGRVVSVHVGSATAHRRQLPSFILVGAQRAGTTSLFRALMAHPLVHSANYHKGVNYFDVNYDRDFSWYQGHFPTEASLRTAQPARSPASRSPSRRAATTCSTRARRSAWPTTCPTCASWRCSATRSSVPTRPTSTSWHAGTRPRAFERALDLEDERLDGPGRADARRPRATRASRHRHHAYRRRGQYAEQLHRLREHFPAERIHVIESEAFFEQPEATYAGVLDFLGLPHAAAGSLRPLERPPERADVGRDPRRAARALRAATTRRWPRCWDGVLHGRRDRHGRACRCGPTTPTSCADTGPSSAPSWRRGVLVGLAWSTQQPRTFSATASVALAPVPVYVMTSADRAGPARGQHRHRRPAAPERPGARRDRRRPRHGPGPRRRAPVGHRLGQHPRPARDRHGRLGRACCGGSQRRCRRTGRRPPPDARSACGRTRCATSRCRSRTTTASWSRRTTSTWSARTTTSFDQLFGAAGILDELREARRAPADVISPADPPRRADYANAEVALTSGAMLGLLVGCLAGAASDRVRRLAGLAGHHAHPSAPGHSAGRRHHPPRGRSPWSLTTQPPAVASRSIRAVRHHLAPGHRLSRARCVGGLAVRRLGTADLHQHQPGAGEPLSGQPVRADAFLRASGRADQPRDRGPGRPLGRGAGRRRRRSTGADHAGRWSVGCRSPCRPTPRSSRSRTRPASRRRPRGRRRGGDQAYLDNRAERFDEVNDERIDRVATRTRTVVDGAARRDRGRRGRHRRSSVRSSPSSRTRCATSWSASAHSGPRSRTARHPPGAVISPASTPADAPQVTAVLFPVGGALVGLAIGCLVAVLLERATGVVRSAAEVEADRGCRSSPPSPVRAGADRCPAGTATARRSTPWSAACVPRSWTSSRGPT